MVDEVTVAIENELRNEWFEANRKEEVFWKKKYRV